MCKYFKNISSIWIYQIAQSKTINILILGHYVLDENKGAHYK